MTILTPNQNEYRVVDGEAYLTVAEAAKRLGIKDNALHYTLTASKTFSGLVTELPTKHGSIKHLDSKTFSGLVAHYAGKGKEQAVKLAIATMQAGMKVFLYGAAGVELPTKPSKELSPAQMLVGMANQLLDQETELKRLEAEKASNQRVQAIEDQLELDGMTPTSNARNTGYCSVSDCKKILKLRTGVTALVQIVIAHMPKPRIKQVGSKTFYYLEDVDAAVLKAVQASSKLSPMTYQHPAGFNFRY